MADQISQDGFALLARDVVDAGREHAVDVERLALGLGMGAHHGLHGLRIDLAAIVDAPVGIAAAVVALAVMGRGQPSIGADVVALANAGGDTSNSLKQAHEFGLADKQKLATLTLNVTNIPSLGLEIVQGATICTGFYWDANDGTRAFAKRFLAADPKHMMPNDMHAGMYAATEHLIKALAVIKSASDGVKLVDEMKAILTDDPLFGKGSIRIDGRKLHPMYLYKAKTPAEIRNTTGTISS